MLDDPYKTLGVTRDASDEELKKAYRTLAKKYHPDNYSGSPLADVAEEKMKEVNDAYDRVKKLREGGADNSFAASSGFGASNGSNASGSYGSPNGFGADDGENPYTAGSSASRYAKVRTLINGGMFGDAELILDAAPESDRTAEWFFLKGCVSYRAGHYFDAQRYFERACYLDPANAEYRSAKDSVSGGAQTFSRRYRRASRSSECDICDALCCYNMMCGGCDGNCCTPC